MSLSMNSVKYDQLQHTIKNILPLINKKNMNDWERADLAEAELENLRWQDKQRRIKELATRTQLSDSEAYETN